MIPVVAPQSVQRVEGVARRLLLGDEAPLLIDLDLAGSGGKDHVFVVEFLGMAAGECQIAGHGVLVDVHQAAGGPGPAALADVAQDIEDLLIGRRDCSRTVPLRSEKRALQARQYTMRIRLPLPL